MLAAAIACDEDDADPLRRIDRRRTVVSAPAVIIAGFSSAGGPAAATAQGN